MSDQQERAAFEAWVADKWPWGWFRDTAWVGWQARAAQAATPAPAPLTLDEIIKLAAIEFPSKQWQSVEHLVRAVERAHGIGQGKEASNG